ncbi:MAG: hypothetical protein OEV59_05995 [Deltaproteobacteria bacterium]|nr:hypothetical protein [Deltaproteobacteria bacterium]
MKLSKVYGIAAMALAVMVIGSAAYAENGAGDKRPQQPPPGAAMQQELTPEKIKEMKENAIKERNSRISDEFGSDKAKKIIAILDKYEIDISESFALRRDVGAAVNQTDRTISVDDAKAKALVERIEKVKKTAYEKNTKRNEELLKTVGGKDTLKFIILENMFNAPPGKGPGGPGGLGGPGGPGGAPSGAPGGGQGAPGGAPGGPGGPGGGGQK